MKNNPNQNNGFYFGEKPLLNTQDKYARYQDYCAVRQLLKWLRADVIRCVELALSNDKETFRLLRNRFLNLFGMAWGAEKKLRDIYNNEHRNGQARNHFEKCRKGDVHEH